MADVVSRMVTFLLAFSFECFSITSHVAIYTTAAGWIIVALLVAWTIITGWEGGETSLWTRTKQRLRALRARFAEDEEEEESEGSSGPGEAGEKESEKRWWARIRMLTPHSLAHSSDRPMMDLGAVSSRV